MGKVYLVGAGPGDAELITVKGVRALKESDVILYDRLVNKALLDYAPAHAEKIYCGKRPNNHALIQEEIHQLLVHHASAGKTVTRLKGGDPFIFGRGGEEAEVLKENDISYEVVPGITSGSAAPAYAGIPLTHRDHSSSVAFVSGVTKANADNDAYWEHLAKGPDTLCIYMGVKHLPDICRILEKHGRPLTTPAALIHWGTTEHQQTVTGTLEDIVEKSAELTNPSMIIIGEVVKLREKVKWFEEAAKQKQIPLEV